MNIPKITNNTASKYHPMLAGAIDLHVHSSPSIFPRKQTDWELVEDIKAARMGGVLLKSHESSTSERAELIRLKEQELQVYGGLACNYFTGGLSPSAVDAAIRLGAKCIWMPTISAQAHRNHFAKVKTRLFTSGQPLVEPEAGLTITNKDGKIRPEIHDILDLIAKADIILSTGHLSPEEVDGLVKLAAEHGIHKILIQHADMGIAPLPLDLQIKLARRGAVIEKCYLACSDDFKDLTVKEMTETMAKIGYDNCVMVTDHGQEHNIPPVQAFSEFVGQAIDCGVSPSAVEQMIKLTPRKLLNL